jgi:hypothetical protein
MKLLTRYLRREIYASILLVFVALIMLFALLDLINELNSMGKGDYRLGYVLLFVALTTPGHIYELFPVAVLIGSIFAMVQMASNSELTVPQLRVVTDDHGAAQDRVAAGDRVFSVRGIRRRDQRAAGATDQAEGAEPAGFRKRIPFGRLGKGRAQFRQREGGFAGHIPDGRQYL